MADVDAYGQFIMRQGGCVPLARTDLAEASEEEIFTDSNFVGSNQSAGTFATQTLTSSVVTAAGIAAENDMTYAYVRSAGKIKIALPVSGLSSGMGLPGALPYPKQRLKKSRKINIIINNVFIKKLKSKATKKLTPVLLPMQS